MTFFKRAILISLLFIVGCVAHQHPLPEPSAHRGIRFAYADNSAEALKAAIDAGIKLIEIDVRKSSDGKLFLYHDRRLKNGLAPEALTIEELRTAKIITFEDALAIIKDEPVQLQLDLKGDELGNAWIAVGIAKKSNQLHQIIIQCQDIETLRALANDPRIALLARVHGNFPEVLKYKPEIVQIDLEDVSPGVVAKIHDAGAKVLTKSLGENTDNQATWCELRDAQVDVVLTDLPGDVKNLKCPRNPHSTPY